MVRGKLVCITDGKGNCIRTPEFNGSMEPTQINGKLAYELLRQCPDVEAFKTISGSILANFPTLCSAIGEKKREERSWFYESNVVDNGFSYEKDANGRDYFNRWSSDFLYVVNLSDEDVTTEVAVGEVSDGKCDKGEFTFKSRSITVLDFGKVVRTEEIVVPE